MDVSWEVEMIQVYLGSIERGDDRTYDIIRLANRIHDEFEKELNDV